MKVLFYVAELQSVEETRSKEEIMFLWAEIGEADVIGVVYELNAVNSLGESGRGAILDILKQYEVDAVVVANARDISSSRAEVCAFLTTIREVGADVISLAGDLPKCDDCLAEMLAGDGAVQRRAYHCTVKIFHE